MRQAEPVPFTPAELARLALRRRLIVEWLAANPGATLREAARVAEGAEK